MSHIYNLTSAHLDQPSIVTIGACDGVHRGHQHLLAPLVREAHASKRQAVVLTLFPHPDVVLQGLSGRYYLTTPEQKAELLASLGVDVVVTHTFDDQVRHISASVFVDQLLEHLNMNSLWLTPDFAMGYEREGNFEYLSAQGKTKGFEVREIDLLSSSNDGRITISSSAIRQCLLAGKVEQAAEWLGRPYLIEGTVVHGDHRGRTIGVPTANLETWPEQVLPANGIYAGWATLGKERFMAMSSLGYRPTFDGKDLRVEAYLLDFDRDIYGQRLQLDFCYRLRDELKFSDVDALVQQIKADVEQGRAMLVASANSQD